MERLEGYARIILDNCGIRPGDVLLIVSNSGRNAVPVEMALLARERGITAVALTSLAHSGSVPSRHSSGKRLFEVADIVIDNCGVVGDAALQVDGMSTNIGPTLDRGGDGHHQHAPGGGGREAPGQGDKASGVRQRQRGGRRRGRSAVEGRFRKERLTESDAGVTDTGATRRFRRPRDIPIKP